MEPQDEKPESLDRLWDLKLQALGEFLEAHYDEGAMDREELDGFFAALHCCPELVPPSEYLPVILGKDPADKEFFPDRKAAERTLGLVLQHWTAVGDALRAGDIFVPLLLEDDEGKAYGNSWAIGFLRGVEMRKGAWKEILEDEDKLGWFTPIFALVHEDDPDPEMRPYNLKPAHSDRRKAVERPF